MEDAKKSKYNKRGWSAIRHPIRFRWMNVTSPIFLLCISLSLLSIVGWWSYDEDLVHRASIQAGAFYRAANRTAGLVVRKIKFEGQNETPEHVLLKAIDIRVGELLLDFDVNAARKRLEAIGWIASAHIERRLPDTIRISIVERLPVAIWQRNGEFLLVDGRGEVIGQEAVERYSNLKILVGADAPENAQSLIRMLEEHPELMDRVTAAIRAGRRRWNLRMDNGIDVKLPENGVNGAWHRLASYQEKYKLLDRSIDTIDLRLPDRVVVKIRKANINQKIEQGNRT